MYQTYVFTSLVLLLSQTLPSFSETIRKTDMRHKTYNRVFPKSQNGTFIRLFTSTTIPLRFDRRSCNHRLIRALRSFYCSSDVQLMSSDNVLTASAAHARHRFCEVVSHPSTMWSNSENTRRSGTYVADTQNNLETRNM